jgi:hypothetical protein
MHDRNAWAFRGFLIATVVLGMTVHTRSQTYPRWFLSQGDVQCDDAAVGYARPSIYKDSSIAQAFRFACDVYAITRQATIRGEEGFWATEKGTVWMGASYDESYDSTLAEGAAGRFVVVDAYTDRAKTIVLAGDSSCLRSSSLRERFGISRTTDPRRIEEAPQDAGYLYAVGADPEYFHEASSWNSAEQRSRLSLARQLRLKIRSLQKLDAGQGQDLRSEEISVTLRNVRVVARWRDVRKKVFYVLTRIEK